MFVGMYSTVLSSSFTISSPDCTMHSVISHVITVFEWQILVRNHTRLCIPNTEITQLITVVG